MFVCERGLKNFQAQLFISSYRIVKHASLQLPLGREPSPE